MKALNDDNPDVRFQASKSLAEIGKPAVEPLLNALKGEDGNTKRYATFIEALSDDDWSVRKTCAKSLGEMGDDAAVEPLIEALKDEDWGVKLAVAKALGDLKDEQAIDPLKKARRAAKGDKEFKKVATKEIIGKKSTDKCNDVWKDVKVWLADDEKKSELEYKLKTV